MQLLNIRELSDQVITIRCLQTTVYGDHLMFTVVILLQKTSGLIYSTAD